MSEKKRNIKDTNELAKSIVDIATGEKPKPKKEKSVKNLPKTDKR